MLSSWDDDLVLESLQMVYPGFEYLLLDEVQNLDGWDLWVSKLYRLGVNMIITGSNAKLLSSEMATLLTGRYIQIEMLPFSLSEFFLWNQKALSDIPEAEVAAAQSLMDDYLHLGGGIPKRWWRGVSRRIISPHYLTLSCGKTLPSAIMCVMWRT